MVVVNWPGFTFPGGSQLTTTIFNTAIVLSVWLTGSTFLGGSQLTTTIH
jgi:hypothetical protein